MPIEQYDVDDIKIRSKYLDLRLRPESIIVTRLFSENLNLPFVVFVVENNNIVLSPPTKIRVKNNIVYFDAENLSGSITLQVDCLLLQTQAYGSRIGVMWPNHRSDCYFADEMRPIDKGFTTTGKFKTPGDDPTSMNIGIPVIHMENEAWMMIHSQLQEPIEFCFFYHNLIPYWNATTDDMLQIAFRSCSSRRNGLSVYYERWGKSTQPPVTAGQLGVEQMKKCLYNNQAVTASDIGIALKHPRQIQEILDTSKIKNCIIGSLAMSIHGFPVETKDCDIAVDSLDSVQACFRKILEPDEQNSMKVSESHKWFQCGARLNLNNISVDFIELSRFDWNQVETVQNLRVLSVPGLLLMKLIGEYERLQMEPNYENFKLKNCGNINLLLKKSPFIYPFFDEFLITHSVENYMNLQNRLQEAAWDSVPMKINEPLIANVFSKKDTTLLPIINNGSEISARVHIERHIRSAQWYPIGQDPINCEASIYSGWSDLIVPKVESLGLLVCQNA